MSMRWSRKGEAFVCESWTPDLIADRDERLGWMMRHSIPWSVLDAQLIPKGGKEVTHLLKRAEKHGRREWKPRMDALERMGVPVNMPEGSYAALGVPGSNATASGTFDVKINTAVGGAYNAALWGTGSTPIAYDSTVAPGSATGGQIWVGLLDSGATNHATYTTDQIHWMDWN
jgi:hypothetical protein